MRFFWKIALITAIPLGGYWLSKKSTRPTKIEIQPEPTEENNAASQSPPGRDAEAKQGGVEQIIKLLTKSEGVTSRVAENLVKRGDIHTRGFEETFQRGADINQRYCSQTRIRDPQSIGMLQVLKGFLEFSN